MITEAINHYHDLLEQGRAAQGTAEALAQYSEQHQLSFGGRAVCTVLRPFFVDSATYKRVQSSTEIVLRAISKLHRALMEDSSLRAEMDLTPEEEEIIQIEPGYKAPDASARMDGFITPSGQIQFVEYNAESPGGLIFGDVLSEVFLEFPVMREFIRRYPVRAIPIRPRVLDTLLGCYREWGGRGSPRIAIVDWETVPTRNEFLLVQEFLSRAGIRSIIADPDELEYADGRLRAGDSDIDLVYKRVVTGELLEKYGLDHPLIHATRDRAVCTVNSFRVQMLYKKMTFALLSDPCYASLFDEEERSAITRHIPWTRKVREGWTSYDRQPGASPDRIDLVSFIVMHKDRLVLKPNGQYGGRGVVLGWTCGDRAWEQAVKDALAGSYVVQERVPLGRERYPSFAEGRLDYDERYFDLDPYVWLGARVEGCGIRLSASELLNVSAGGGSAVPMFVVEPVS